MAEAYGLRVISSEEWAEQERSAAQQRWEAERAEEEADAHRVAEAEVWKNQAPPSDSELAINTSKYAPARALLIRFSTWIAKLRTELETLEQGRAAFMATLNVPAMTEAALNELVSQDKTSFLKWLYSGGKIAKPVLREFEQEQLRAKLTGDRHAEVIAREAMEEAEAQIAKLTRMIEVLGKRRPGVIGAAMVERARADGEAYLAAARVLEDKLARLLGLATVAIGTSDADGGHFYTVYGQTPTFSTRLPSFGMNTVPGRIRPQIEVTERQVESAAEPWRALAKAWSADPRKEP